MKNLFGCLHVRRHKQSFFFSADSPSPNSIRVESIFPQQKYSNFGIDAIIIAEHVISIRKPLITVVSSRNDSMLLCVLSQFSVGRLRFWSQSVNVNGINVKTTEMSGEESRKLKRKRGKHLLSIRFWRW